MISSGLFVLPALAYAKAGPAVILSYLFASILIIPSAFSQAELATAMPRAGGTYFYVERSLGPIWGLFGGLANWFSVALKSAFAIVGMAGRFQQRDSSVNGDSGMVGPGYARHVQTDYLVADEFVDQCLALHEHLRACRVEAVD